MTGSTRAHLRPFLMTEWRPLAGAGLMTGLMSLADLIQPWPLKLVIDDLVRGRTGGFAFTVHDAHVLAAVALLIVAVAAIDATAAYCSDRWLQSAGERIAHALRVALYEHLQQLSLHFHSRRAKGDLVTRLTEDVNSIGELFAGSLGTIVQGALLLVGMVVVTAVIDPLMAGVLALTMPVVAVVTVPLRRRVKASARDQRAEEGEIASRATEALSAMPVVKAFGSERLEADRVHGPSERRMAFGILVSRAQARYDGLVTVVTAGATAVVIVVGALRVASGALSPGDLVVLATYARKATQPIRQIARESGKVLRTVARADRIAELLAVDDVLHERPDAYSGPPSHGAVALDGVSFAYGADRPVLRDVSLAIAPGEHVAVIGASGAGKSTLASLIARFHDPVEGRVLIDGRDARDCALDWLRRQVGVLLQETVLFSGTVRENIAYGSAAGDGEVALAARAAAAHDFISSLPQGYDTELGPQGLGLSGGQRQRLGIARTILRDPAILVLDEPTTGLDSESEERVLAGLRRLMEGRTTLIVTHSLALARTADRVLAVQDGRIVADGTPDDVLTTETQPEVLQR